MRPICVTVALLALAACGIDPTGPERFIIQVDSVTAPLSVDAYSQVPATFHGFIGGTNCWSLESVERRDTSGGTSAIVDFTFFGERCPSGNGDAITILLRQAEVLHAPGSGALLIRVHQPDGTTLTRSVAVRTAGTR